MTRYEIFLRTELFSFFPHFFQGVLGGVGGGAGGGGVPLQKSAFHAWNYSPPPLSKSAHTFVLCPTHFPLSFLMPTPPQQRLPPPFPPLALFLFASALRGLREKGRTTPATPSRTDTPSARRAVVQPCFA